jgi:hypothetical protein
VIRFPKTEVIEARARALQVPLPVIVRDLARIVEILNLREQGFFDKDTVLAGGMAMRTYGSQRLTIYDADLSTRAVTAPSQIERLLTYTVTTSRSDRRHWCPLQIKAMSGSPILSCSTRCG